MAYSRARTAVPGKHSRPPGVEEVRRTCLAVLTMLIAQYALGIFLNLFVTVPASDKQAGLLGAIVSGPFALTLHALLGLSLIGTAVMLLVRVVRVEDPVLIALATSALGAIGGAFAAGEIFVKDGGQTAASFTMALLAGVAMLCYVGMLALISAPRRRKAHAAHVRGTSGLLADPVPDPGWPPDAWSEPVWSEQGWSEPAWSEPAPLPVRQKQERTVVGVTWEAPWSQGPTERYLFTGITEAARKSSNLC
jgi:hypothetical protein